MRFYVKSLHSVTILTKLVIISVHAYNIMKNCLFTNTAEAQ